jgi:hypothetical protein
VLRLDVCRAHPRSLTAARWLRLVASGHGYGNPEAVPGTRGAVRGTAPGWPAYDPAHPLRLRCHRPRIGDRTRTGIFAGLKQTALGACDHIVGLACGTSPSTVRHPGGGRRAAGICRPQPVDRGKQGMKRSSTVDGHGVGFSSLLSLLRQGHLPIDSLRHVGHSPAAGFG